MKNSTQPKPIVTFIMPAFKVEKHIAASIESVQQQDFDAWELIVVNDGSPDQSRTIAMQYAATDPRIQVVDKTNGGLSDARNFGFAKAEGRYVAFIDSDDFITPSAIAKGIARMEEEQADIAIFSYTVDHEDESGKLIKSVPTLVQDALFTPEQYKTIPDSAFPNLYYAWNKLYRADFLRSYQFNFEKGLRLIEDCEFNTRVLPKASKILFVSAVLNRYMIRNEATLSKMMHPDVFELQKRAINCKLSMFRQMKVAPLRIEKLEARFYMGCIRYVMYCLLRHARNQSFVSKVKYLYPILRSEIPAGIFRHVEAEGMKDKLVLNLIRAKSAVGLIAVYKLSTILQASES